MVGRYDGIPTKVISMLMRPGDDDQDPLETREWMDSLSSVVEHSGRDRGLYLLKALSVHARGLGVTAAAAPYSAYRNTISVGEQPSYPGNLAIEERLTALMRWNALAM